VNKVDVQRLQDVEFASVASEIEPTLAGRTIYRRFATKATRLYLQRHAQGHSFSDTLILTSDHSTQ